MFVILVKQACKHVYALGVNGTTDEPSSGAQHLLSARGGKENDRDGQKLPGNSAQFHIFYCLASIK